MTTRSKRRARTRFASSAAALLLAAGCGTAPAPQEVSGLAGAAGVAGSGSVPLDAVDALQASNTQRVRRLSAREYDNVVRDLLGDASSPAKRFIPDAFQNGYDNGSVGLAIQSDQVMSYQTAAEALAKAAVENRLSQLLAGCDVAEQGEDECAEAFLSSFVPRAFRRPPTDTELSRLRVVYDDAFDVLGFSGGIQTALEAILQSPQFLYREELGPADAQVVPGKSVQLTDYEVATQLSFLLTGTSPDDTLWSAVVAGRFKTREDHAREAERLLSTDGARETLRAFLHQWLATDRLASVTKDLSAYPAFSPTLTTSMTGELDRFFDAVLWQGQGSLRELFTSNQSFADPALAQLYGAPVTAEGFQSITLDPTIRAGVLTRAGFLAVHSAIDSSGPIARGVFVLQSLLCAPPPPPPADVPPAAPAGDPLVKDLTTRQRFERHVSTPFCAACHQMIDGVGFGFEQFDGIGAHRTTEKGQPIDSSGTLVNTGGIDGPYVGVAELSRKLADSQPLRDCFVKQAYRFGMGQVEPADSAAALSALAGDFSSEASVVTVLLELVRSPLFTTRSVEPPRGGSKP